MMDVPTPTRRRALDRLRAIVLEAVAPYEAAVYLFGSSAGGEVRRASDIDIGILPKGPMPRSFFAELAERLEQSTIPYDMDLVDLSTVSPEFLAEVRRTGVLWRA